VTGAASLGPPTEALALVPGLEHGEQPTTVRCLAGGSVNHTWRVDSAQGRFVVRADGAQWRRPGVDRARELALHTAAAAAGLAPRIVCAATRMGVLVSEFVEGRIWTPLDLTRTASLDSLGECLAQLHALTTNATDEAWSFEPGKIFAEYIENATRAPGVVTRGPPPSEVIARVQTGVEAAHARVIEGGAGPAIVHGDLVCSNLLAGSRLWLLDWEYAQRTAPLYDFACLLAYYDLGGREQARLLAAAGVADRYAPRTLSAATYVYRALTWAWHLARGEAAEAPTWPEKAGVGPGRWAN